jgi:hypothetical protein
MNLQASIDNESKGTRLWKLSKAMKHRSTETAAKTSLTIFIYDFVIRLLFRQLV